MARSVQVLLLDDGELDDIQQILQEQGIGYGRVRGGAIVDNTPAPSKLLVATPRRIDAVHLPEPGSPEADGLTRIVVVSEDSTTLRARLREVGFDYLVRRPVHPEALRLLVLHCVYSGEERRREPRVPVGLEVSFRTGLLPRRATLADLSTRGARILSRWPLEPGRRITITIPQSTGIPEAITLKGRVIRMSLDEHLGPEGPYWAAIAFNEIKGDTRHELEWILEERARGPATLRPNEKGDGKGDGKGNEKEDRADAEPAKLILDPPETRASDLEHDLSVPVDIRMDLEPDVDADDAADNAGDDPAVDPSVDQADDPSDHETTLVDANIDKLFDDPAPAVAAPSRADAVTKADDDRRTTPRHDYDRKVPAFGDRAMRVLVARDLSMGGMRVEPDTGLELGDRIHLAIYGAADEEPFLVWATVTRDDGEDGMALVFENVHEVVAQQLEAVVATLPAVESLHDDEVRAMGTVITEILES